MLRYDESEIKLSLERRMGKDILKHFDQFKEQNELKFRVCKAKVNPF